MDDKRFSFISSDPRFRPMPKKSRKVVIDKRFKGMFNNKNFKVKYTVDKRGRPVQSTTNENLKKFYELSDSETEDEDKETVKPKKADKKISKQKDSTISKNKKKDADKEQSDQDESDEVNDELDGTESDEDSGSDKEDQHSSTSSSEDLDEETSMKIAAAIASGKDLARGEGNVSSSEDEDNFELEEDQFDHQWGEIDKNAPEINEVTARLAVCNMDWDRIKAQDLLVLLNSFKPSGGVVKKVCIYPSEFGLQRMAEEDLKGPKELVEYGKDEVDNANSEGSSYHMEKLRQYQLNRLKYYYAVVECDSPQTANNIYEECDGLEYESSCTKIDLRFIPDDMTFDQEAKSIATDMPDTVSYQPSLFVSKALNQSKVELTWDETDKKRQELLMRKFNKDDLEKMNVHDYLASSSSEDEDPYSGIELADFLKKAEEKEGEKAGTSKEDYKSLLTSVMNDDDEEKVEGNEMEMQITWEPGLRDNAENMINKKNKGETPWEKYLSKKKEKKVKKRNQEDDKSKEKTDASDEEDELPAGIDLNDSYFKEEIDKMQQPAKEKPKTSKKKKKRKNKTDDLEQDPQEKAELSLLLMNEDDEKDHFSLKAIQEQESITSKTKKKKKKMAENKSKLQDNFKINVDDSRFKDIYENPLFNIDPSAAEYKATNSMEVLAREKVKRRTEFDKKKRRKSSITESEPSSKKLKDTYNSSDVLHTTSKDSTLANLVKSVKAKTKNILDKKSRLN